MEALSAILWIVALTLWFTPGKFLPTILTAAVVYECVFLLFTLPPSSLPAVLQSWPLLRPASWLMAGLAAGVLVANLFYRRHHSSKARRA